MGKGWIKLHRKIIDSQMYRHLNSKQRDVLLSCLLMANHSETEWEFKGDIYKTKEGEFVTSLDNICRNCSNDVKVQSVRTALLKLEKWGFLTNKSTKTGRLITICKWEDYQQKESSTNKEDNKEPTKSQQSSNKDLTSNKNDKKEKNDNNDKKVNSIPSFVDFFNHAKSKIDNISELSVKLKYDSWIENDWKDGNDKKINNWKSKLTNTVKYLDTNNAGGNKPRDRFDTSLAPAKFDDIPDKMH